MRLAPGLALTLILATPAFAQDADQDGAANGIDAYPCDASVASVSFAPAEGETAVVLFEDRWPSRADLDFNDVVLAYNYVLRMNAAGRVLQVTATFDALAVGGILDNGFGLHLPVAASSVGSITRRIGDGAPETLLPADDVELTVQISQNLRELFDHAEGPINSRADLARVTAPAITVEVTFAEPVMLSAGAAPFDLYIFRTEDPGHEIHRPEFAGTAAMKRELFGAGDDGSTDSRHFVDDSGLPFALVLPSAAAYPGEELELSALYPEIVAFAASGGETHRDFYLTDVRAQFAYPHFVASAPSLAEPDRTCLIDDGATPESAGRSCKRILDQGASRGDGLYWIDPDADGARPAVRVYCDMTTDGGGWTMIARASDTNGLAGDYEFRAVAGAQRSLLNVSFSAGEATGPQYTLALDSIFPEGATRLDLQYHCYDPRSWASTRYWAAARDLEHARLRTWLTDANPDFLYSGVRVDNMDGASTNAGIFGFLGRETTGTARCGNGYAGQNGIKFSCASSGQTAMNPRSVWMLTHYGTHSYTEVTSCGSRGGDILPFFAGEVRFREHDCENELRDGTETDVDCGGSACGACDSGLVCAAASDCASSVCSAGVCAAPSCSDGVQNGVETSIDCGGNCGNTCAYATCATILGRGLSRGSGYYDIDPDGSGANAPFRAYCDMESDGGGWTMLARASDTNGVAGDYEFRAMMGARSLLGRTFTGGSVEGPQYTIGIDRVIPPGSAAIDLQYYCYDRRSPASTTYWALVRGLNVGALASGLNAANPDFLMSNLTGVNRDGVTATNISFGMFGRETSGTATCGGNTYAGQTGLKFGCSGSGQQVLNPRSVWMLTHYGNYAHTEVTSCGSYGAAALPYFAGEVRFRERACGNGVQDGAETGVDCGAACGVGCAMGNACNSGADCRDGLCGAGVCVAPSCNDRVHNGNETSIDCGGSCGASCLHTSCRSLLVNGLATASGEYRIDPDGGGPNASFIAYCDMTTDGGGWTLVARASDTNGAGGDYEFRTAFGQTSIMSNTFSGGAPRDPQYALALSRAIPPSQSAIELQYYCYDARNQAGTRYWAKVRNLSAATLRTSLNATNPDFLYTGLSIENADGVTAANGNYGLFGRESSGTANCGNGIAGQSGIKFSCTVSGQTAMNPRGVWYLTHYANQPYTEVTSCGPTGGNVLPYFAGEIRYR